MVATNSPLGESKWNLSTLHTLLINYMGISYVILSSEGCTQWRAELKSFALKSVHILYMISLTYTLTQLSYLMHCYSFLQAA